MAFWPGLSGPFLLDDLLHLPKLAENGSVETLRSLMQLTFSGTSATGRPISFLSLLLNDNTWPSQSFSFKYTNLMFHLLNGVLVFVLTRQIGRIIGAKPEDTPRVNAASLLVMAIWLLHPIHLSPVMLVIQRMTLLMGMFSLLGLITYLRGRVIVANDSVRGYLLMSLGIGLFGILGALSKEPAVMMVCYVIAMEVTIFSHVKLERPMYWKWWAGIFLILPLTGVALYFIGHLPRMDELYLKRDFNMPERLMTEARIVLDYLRVIITPGIASTGPYHDDYVISRGLFEPLSTIISILFIIISLVLAIRLRNIAPLFAMAVLWFFMGHILESTILPLELYFEHRNYLPMLGVVMAAVLWLVFKCPLEIRKILISAALLFVVFETGISYSAAKVWNNFAMVATIWAEERPASIRAQLDAIRFWLTVGDIDRVNRHLSIAKQHNPDVAGIHLYEYIIQHCSKTEVTELGITLDELREVILKAPFEHGSLSGLDFIQRNIKSGRCQIEKEDFLFLVDSYLENPKFNKVSTSNGQLQQLKSYIYVSNRQLGKAIIALDKTYDAVPRYDFALNQAYLLMTAGLYEDAQRYIEKARNTKPYNMFVGLWQEDHIQEIEQLVLKFQEKNNAQKQETGNDDS